MMIMRFHKLIQSRLLWMIFLGVVVVSFVFWGSMEDSGDGGVSQQLRMPVAQLNGKTIRFLEFDTTRRMIERNLQGAPDREQLDELVFERFAMVDFAKSLGLSVPESLAQQEFLRSIMDEQGQLDPAFHDMVRRSLRSEGLSEELVINFIRDEMLIQEVRRILTSMVPVSSFDVERWASVQTDLFEIALIGLDDSLLEGDINVTDDELSAFFSENAEQFRIPERRSVSYLKLDVSAFEKEEDVLSEEEAKAFYEQNTRRFSRGVPVQNEDGTFEFKMETIPFEEAIVDIRTTYRQHLARERAEDEAMGLSVRLTPRRGRSPLAMDALAAERDMTVYTAGPFRAGDFLQEVSNSSGLIQTAFELDLSEIGRISRPVLGRDAVYVLQLTDISPPRDPELDEIRDEVLQAAIVEARRNALEALAKSRAEEIRTALAEGTPFNDAAAALGFEIESLPPVSLQSLNAGMPMVPRALAMELSAHQAGDLIGPVADERMGRFVIATVLSREAQEEEMSNLIPQLRTGLAAELHFPGFLQRFQEMTLLKNLDRLLADTRE